MGATLGVIGYGDIGQACARKAKAVGMKIIGQRRRPELSHGDGVADEVLGAGQVRRMPEFFCSKGGFNLPGIYFSYPAQTILLPSRRVCKATSYGVQKNDVRKRLF